MFINYHFLNALKKEIHEVYHLFITMTIYHHFQLIRQLMENVPYVLKKLADILQ